jgi:hypothetical protein
VQSMSNRETIGRACKRAKSIIITVSSSQQEAIRTKNILTWTITRRHDRVIKIPVSYCEGSGF